MHAPACNIYARGDLVHAFSRILSLGKLRGLSLSRGSCAPHVRRIRGQASVGGSIVTDSRADVSNVTGEPR